MKIIYGIQGVKRFKHPVIALGVFDGLHLGHRRILKAVVSKARQINGVSLVLTFFPHPRAKESLYSLAHRLRLIAELGVDVCIVVNFSRKFARISPRDFIAKVLVGKIGAEFVYVGRNFRFGRQAAGDCRLLIKEARQHNFQVKIFEVTKNAGLTVSSTVIRQLIKNSKIKKAQNLLGRRVSVLGTVINGSRLGRCLGFPTANIKAHHEVIPPAGIYAAKIILGEKKYNGICYIGKRPTLNLNNKPLRIEVHIFNFHKNIYGQVIEIQFVKLIRKDRKFSSLQELSRQIKKDIVFCRKIL